MNPQALVPANRARRARPHTVARDPGVPGGGGALSALLPKTPAERARVRSLAQYVVSEIQPMQNLRVQRHLFGALGRTEEEGIEWRRHWVALGLDALEKQLQDGETGTLPPGAAPRSRTVA